MFDSRHVLVYGFRFNSFLSLLFNFLFVQREEYARVEEAGGDNESFLAAKRKEYQEIVEFLSWESRKVSFYPF